LRRENVSGARSSTHWNSQPEKWIVALIAGNSDSSRRNGMYASSVATARTFSKFPTGWWLWKQRRRARRFSGDPGPFMVPPAFTS